MLVVAKLALEVKVEISDKYKALDTPQTRKDYFSNPLCKDCEFLVWLKIHELFPELSEFNIQEIYSAENFHTLYEYF